MHPDAREFTLPEPNDLREGDGHRFAAFSGGSWPHGRRIGGSRLSPGRYVGAPIDEASEESYSERLLALTEELESLFAESASTQEMIRRSLGRLLG